MPRYIALLRAVNVGGTGIIKMEDLRGYFAMPGFSNVVTYIQSGNVLFDSKETDKALLVEKIEKKLLKSVGKKVDVILRSLEEMTEIVKKDPFKKQRTDKDKYYVVFLSAIPDKELAKQLEALSNDVDSFKIVNDNLYWLTRPYNGATIIKGSFFDKKLKVLFTNRNWNTVNKVLDL